MLTRRTVLQGMGAGLIVLPLGCAEDALQLDAGTHPDATNGNPDAITQADASNPDAMEQDAGLEDSGDPDSGVVMGWATGGTAAITGLNYPDPFAGGFGDMCPLFPASTLGPCHAMTLDRQDVSEGSDGLPMRLILAVVDDNCNLIPNASVEIWHTSPAGNYSGSDAIAMCTNGDPEAAAARYFRGIRTANNEGRIVFDTCFPGWYSGRTIHIHFTVRVGDIEYLTSQLYFNDALNNEILTTHPAYAAFGPKNTSNNADGILRATGNIAIMETQRMDDGVLLAWKALSINR